MIAAVGVEHPLHDDLAPLVLEVDIDVRWLAPRLRHEALEQQIVAPGSIEVMPSTKQTALLAAEPRPWHRMSRERANRTMLAIPFLGPQDQVVLILYADCNKLDFFANDERVARLVALSKGLCRLFDSLQKEP